jgi:mRNA interferase MazF
MEVLKRGDIVSAILSGDYGKPRPALIMQHDAFREIPSLTVLPLTSDLRGYPLVRITVEPSPENGLQKRSDIMIDKAQTAARSKIGQRIGAVDARTMHVVSTALANFLGLGEL